LEGVLALGYSNQGGKRELGPVKLGVFGGTFNPIHHGHLHLARGVQRLFDLERVYFVVATAPPHKAPENLIPFMHRYAMVSLATASRPSFSPSLIELEPPCSSFSSRTMAKLAERHDGQRGNLYFIAGGDSLLEVGGWHESGELLNSYNFVFVARAGVPVLDAASALPVKVRKRVRDLRGFGTRQIRSCIRAEDQREENRLFVVDVGAPDVSASHIRSLVAEAKKYSHLVPPSVYQYIQKLHLYGD
jgi:nicotinate-nucleotide adenylyltransferase